jgi:hypothetical protein
LLRIANFQLEIRASACTYVQRNVLLLRCLETRRFGTDSVMPDWKVRSYIFAALIGGQVD